MHIDWQEQWRLHAPNFRNGVVHIPPYDFFLKPGPGFGDLSHPTTRLMLSLMPKHISLPVIDIGCGSGILSLAAFCAGAPKVYGIDIHTDVIQHAQANAKLNNFNIFFGTTLPKIHSQCMVFMNMISSEQVIAWQTHKALHPYIQMLIVSGILTTETPPISYGALTATKKLKGWLGLRYETKTY